ncbi:MAG: response regulator [Chloroflexota bacterium]|nr:response regulator [Chloroflexota bacterium]
MTTATSAAPTVLVVEDSDVIRRVISLILEGEGYQVLVTDRAAEALALARYEQPAAVTLDLNLPDADGRDVLRQLKGDRRTTEIPVIVVSAFAEGLSSDDRRRADDVIAKPFDLDDFLGRVGRAVGERSFDVVENPTLSRH